MFVGAHFVAVVFAFGNRHGHGAKRRHFDGLVAAQSVHDLKAPADNARTAYGGFDLFRCGVGRDIEIFRRAAGEQIAHGAADDKRLVAGLLQLGRGAQRAGADHVALDAVFLDFEDARLRCFRIR